MTRIAVCLISGGIDSTTCLYHAYEATPSYAQVYGVSIDYGQRHVKEIEYAKVSCAALGVPHETLKNPQIFPTSMLTDSNVDVPDISYSDITGISPTYVPFRNGTMLALLTAYTTGKLKQIEATEERMAQGEAISGHVPPYPPVEADIYFGAHAEDAANWAYPDCTPEFIGAMANAIYVGSYRQIRLVTPLEWMNKRQIIEHGTRLGVKWENTWSCYKGLRLQCGTCPTCRSRREGFINAHIPDPTDYAESPATFPERMDVGVSKSIG
ncbi:MAG: 7-cyano-7-deazaguanine synthase [Nitrospira sp.]